MKVTAVKATSHLIPLDVIGHNEREPQKEYAICVRVQTDEGISGAGWFSNRANRQGARDLINNTLGPVLIGQDPMNTEAILSGYVKRFDIRGMVGLMVHALSGIDVALWDIKGRALKQPVYKLLGGFSAKVPVYDTFGFLAYTKEELVDVAKKRVAEGQDKLKMLVATENSGNIPEDAARIKAVRDVIGDKIELMLDANQRFNPLQAAELCKRIEDYDIKWFEEPVINNDIHDMAVLRTKTSIPLSAGQAATWAWQHRLMIAGGAIDIDQPDVVVCGGFTEGIKAAHIAQSFDMPIATHGWPAINMHLVAAVPNGWRVEFHEGQVSLCEKIYVNPPKAKNGFATCYDKPGLGMELNEDNLKKFQDKD